MLNGDQAGSGPIRVALQQPSLPRYRVPVFAELAKRPGIRLHLHYATNSPVPSVEPAGFEATASPLHQLLGGRLLWHHPQWTGATKRTTDVLVLSWNARYLSLFPALLRARARGVKTVLWGHGCSKHERWWRRRIRNWAGGMADALLLYNHTAARQLIAEGFAPERVHVALNSLDQGAIGSARTAWLSRPDDLAAFRAEHGLDGPTVLFVSRFEEANRADVILRAAARLLAKHPKLKVVLVGKGPDGDRLRGLAAELGLEGAAIFPGAIYDEMQLAPWFLSASVFCYPANMGLSLLHAFGYGVPVVTGDRAELHGPEIEALEDGVNGLLFAHGDDGALAKALDRVLSDPELRQRMSAAALDTVLSRFSIARMVDGMEGAIRQAAGRLGPPTAAGDDAGGRTSPAESDQPILTGRY